jgi:hypothetical protein
MKVHVIEAEMYGSIVDVVANRDKLGRSIAQLAVATGEQVYFHDFKDPVGGAPVVMLECSDAFLAQVKRLPGYSTSYDVWPDMETERKPSIQNYFTQAPASAAPPPNKNTPPRKPSAPKP